MLIERYLVAKIGTSSLVSALVGRLHYDGWRGFDVLLGYCVFMIIAVIK